MGENIEAEGEIELSLGLSIGGAFRKTKEKPLSLHRRSDLNDCEIKEIDDKDACFAGSCASPFGNGLNLKEGIGNSNQQDGFLEQQRKRELHALRRQEARKKRENKQQKKGVYRGRNSIFMNHSMDDKMLLEAQEYASRVRDRAVKENEASRSERCCKKDEQRYGFGDDQTQTLSLARSQSETENKPSCGVGGGGYRAPQPAFSVVPMQYPFQLVPNNHHHHLQYLPFSNGIRFPYMMPYWAAPPANDGSKYNQDAVGINGGNVFQPVPCRSFRPFQTPPLPPAASWDSEQNNRAEGRVEQDQIQPQSSLASTGTPVSSSSAVSDYQSTSPQGGSSSDTPSHWSLSKSEQQHSGRVSLARDPKGRQSEHSDSSLQMEAGRDTEEANEKSNTVQSSPQRTEESISLDKNEGENNNPTPELGEEEKMSSKPSVPEMPCVSTTGNGPNGKTISGFLYRYTKSEVSIVCVCHGNSFTPAEFVKHAGGTDISHPLRHIVVVPSSF